MRITLIPLQIDLRQPKENLVRLARHLTALQSDPPDLVCLPECTLTGYLYQENDFTQFAEPIPGPTTEAIGRLTKDLGSNLCFGMLELSSKGVYDSAVVLDRKGHLLGVHRKINEKPPFITGHEINAFDLDVGSICVLICGDLFDGDVISRIPPSAGMLLVPMYRCFEGKTPDLDRWVREEQQYYLTAVSNAGLPTVCVNAFEDGPKQDAFGGGMVINPQGMLLAESPHGSDQVITWDLNPNID